MIPFKFLYDEFIDRSKLSEIKIKNEFGFMGTPPTKGCQNNECPKNISSPNLQSL